MLRQMLEQMDHCQFELVGFTDRLNLDADEIRPINARVSQEQSEVRLRQPRTWRGVGNASRRHAAAVLRSLGLR